MALITMRKSDGQTMTIDENSPIKQSLLNQGWSQSTTSQAVDSSKLNTTPLGNSGVNALFKQYYGRDATQAELDYWRDKSDAQLRPKLIPNSTAELARNKKTEESKTGTTSAISDEDTLSSEQKNELEKLNQDIDSMSLSIEEKAILKQIAGMDFTSGNKIPTTDELNKIIQTAATNAETDLSPYYEKLSARELEDMKTNMENIRNQVANYTAAETAGYKSKLAETKASLRARGLTFSGTSRATLGAEGAISSEGVEGSIPEARRLDYATYLQQQKEAAQKTGIESERLLGSQNVSGLQVSTPYGTSQLYNPKALGQEGYTKTGDISLDRLKAIEESKWDRVSKSRSYI